MLYRGDNIQTITLLNADAIDGMRSIEEKSIDMVVTSPPYGIGKSYEVDVSQSTYSKLVVDSCREFKRILKPDGRFAINVPINMNSEDGTHFVMREWESTILNAGLNMRDTIIWNQMHTGCNTAWGSFQSASSPWIRHQCEVILIGYNKQWKKMNKGTSDINNRDFTVWTCDHWDIPTARCSWHPAVFPDELAKRLIQLFSYVGDTICDPFCGSGTVLRVGRDLKRNVIGIDRDREYCDKIRSSDTFNQSTLYNDVKYIYKEIQ